MDALSLGARPATCFNVVQCALSPDLLTIFKYLICRIGYCRASSRGSRGSRGSHSSRGSSGDKGLDKGRELPQVGQASGASAASPSNITLPQKPRSRDGSERERQPSRAQAIALEHDPKYVGNKSRRLGEERGTSKREHSTKRGSQGSRGSQRSSDPSDTEDGQGLASSAGVTSNSAHPELPHSRSGNRKAGRSSASSRIDALLEDLDMTGTTYSR